MDWIYFLELPDFSKITFPDTKPINLETIVPDAPDEAVDLFKKFVRYDSAKRIVANEALKHVYFCTPPLASNLEQMPRPREKRTGTSSGMSQNQQSKDYNTDVSFNEMFVDLFELASK
jgi:serine/threonine protein kinase